jgi:hypothetical protein
LRDECRVAASSPIVQPSPMLPLSEAPRIYIDTAYLCDIADRKIDAAALDRCCQALKTSEAVVIFGPAHMMDLHRHADSKTRAELFAVVDRFPRAATVRQSPPLSGDHRRLDALLMTDTLSDPVDLPDLVLEDCTGNLKATLGAAGYDEAEWVVTARQGEALSMQGAPRGADDTEPLPTHVRKVLAETFAMEIRGEDGVARLMERTVHPKLCEHPDAKAFESRLRALRVEYEPFLQLLKQLVARYGGSADRFARRPASGADGIPVWWSAVPNGIERWLRTARAVAPGLYLKTMLLRAKNRDSNRTPRPSDNADEFHVAMVPYVDVITLDRENLAVIGNSIREIRTVRPVSLVGNGDVESLIGAIERLSRPGR